MSVRVMTAVWAVDLPASEKLVLLALADCANDEGDCWPSMRTLAAKCSKSDRTIQGAVKALVLAGHITRNEVPGKGCSYVIHPRKACAPEETAPPKKTAQTPEDSSDKPSRTVRTQKGKPSVSRAKRAPHPLPDDWTPADFGEGTECAQVVALWQPGRKERELSKFRANHLARGSRFRDWQAAWRTWVLNSVDFERAGNGRSGTYPMGGHQSGDGLSATTRAARDVFGPHAGHS